MSPVTLATRWCDLTVAQYVAIEESVSLARLLAYSAAGAVGALLVVDVKRRRERRLMTAPPAPSAVPFAPYFGDQPPDEIRNAPPAELHFAEHAPGGRCCCGRTP